MSRDEVMRILSATLSAPVEPLTLKTESSPDTIDPDRFVGQIETTEDGDLRLSLDALTALVPEERADELVVALQGQLQPYGYQVLQTTHGHMDFCLLFNIGVVQANERYKDRALLVIFAAPDPASLLYVRQTNGANLDVMPQDIVNWLDAWHKKSEFTVVGAGHDWIELHFTKLPDDLEAFARQVYEFCPDTLDQGIVKAIPEEFEDMDSASEEQMEEMLEWMEEALDEQTPADLADHIERTGRLWLWWD